MKICLDVNLGGCRILLHFNQLLMCYKRNVVFADTWQIHCVLPRVYVVSNSLNLAFVFLQSITFSISLLVSHRHISLYTCCSSYGITKDDLLIFHLIISLRHFG